MTVEQQKKALATKRLYLSGRRACRYYLDSMLMTGFCLVVAGKAVRHQTTDTGIFYLVAFLLLVIITFFFFLNERKALAFRELDTAFSAQQNYELVQEALSNLQWNILIYNEGFVEAYTATRGFLQPVEQMISIVITENNILFNCISNVDVYIRSSSARLNKRTMNVFIETFERVAPLPATPRQKGYFKF